MGIFKKTNEIMYFRAFYENYTMYQKENLSPQQIVSQFITDSPQSGKKPLKDFSEKTTKKFAAYFVGLEHDHARLALCNMIVFGLRQGVDVSDYNDETMHQFIDNAKEINDEEKTNS